MNNSISSNEKQDLKDKLNEIKAEMIKLENYNDSLQKMFQTQTEDLKVKDD